MIFLSPAPELRNKIYHCLVVSNEFSIDGIRHCHPEILATCSKIKEAGSCFYACNIVSLLFSSAQHAMAPSTREWWRISHLPTETYTISEDHTIMFEQIIGKHPEFLRTMHAFFSSLETVSACMSNFPGRFTTLLPKVHLIRYEASCQH